MKKIAIVTIESINFGNRLQNYALQYILESIGCVTKTIHRRKKKKGVKAFVKLVIQDILQTKASKFRRFDKYIHFSDITIGRDDYPEDISEKFDYFIVGSDQVWNPHYDFVSGKCDFLTFAESKQKISYAASFGVCEIPIDRKEEFARYIKDFKSISVRESQGACIVEGLTNRKAEVVLDPTLLLGRQIWENVERKPAKMPRGKYALVYSLGEKNERFIGKMNALADKYSIYDIRSLQKSGKEQAIGPSEFLFLIRNAEIILTDSFHATVFSLIYHKKFVTFTRDGINMGSRIDSLSRMLNIQDYIDDNGDLLCETEIDFETIENLLEIERIKSIDFLKSALAI